MECPGSPRLFAQSANNQGSVASAPRCPCRAQNPSTIELLQAHRACGVPRGRPPSPWLGRRPRRTPGADGSFHPGEAARPGRGGSTLDRAAVIRPSPSQTLLPLAGRHIPRRPLPRQDDATHGRNLQGSPCRTGSQIRDSPVRLIPWHAPSSRLPGPVEHTCCLPGHGRS